MAPLEFDPRSAAGGAGTLRIDVPEVERVLVAFRGEGASASTSSGWDSSFPVPGEG